MRTKSSRFLLTIALVTLALIIFASGCSQPASVPTSAPVSSSSTAAAAAPAAATTSAVPAPATAAPAGAATAPAPAQAVKPGKRIITDMTGRNVEIPEKITRVAISFPALNQMVFMLGSADKIVATVVTMKTNVVFGKMYPRIKEVPTPLEPEPNIEALVATKPDVLFVAPGKEDLYKQIEQAGIPVMIFKSFANPTEIQDGVRLVGKVLGGDAEKKAEEFSVYYQNNVKRISAVTSSIAKEQRPKVYYSANNPLNTEGKNTIVQIWVEMGGGLNVAAEAGVDGSFKDVSMEDVAKWNPDYVIVRDAVNTQNILKDERWKQITALKQNHVLTNPKGVFIWGVRSAEEALQTLWIAKTLQPAKFPDLDIQKETKDFYKKFYNYDLSDTELKETLSPTS